jgi:protocatechuate 3,4-dioxygenase beta subunit
MDTILPAGVDLFADAPTLVPNYVAGETETADDGTFLIDGVWPRAFYLLLAGIGTDAPSHRLLQHSPRPGEILDLGDIVLDHSAVATGRVVDDGGDPVAGALVRGVDLPGQLLSFLPVERFEPTGCVLVREANSPIKVVELPAWVESAFEHLPIPTTRTDADGMFRLAGIVPGDNVIATTQTGMLADVKPGVRFEPGQVKDLGTIRLRQGEEFSGRVLDTNGKPVEGAEVVAGSTLTVVPFDFAVRLGKTDADGRVAGTGFGPGRVTMAARRHESDPWVLAEPQPIFNDAVVTLPAVGTLTVRVTFQGAVVREPRLRLLPGRRGEEVVVMAVLGLNRSIDLQARTTHLEDGQVVLSDLPVGRYVLVATSEIAAVETAEVDLSSGSAQVAIELRPRVEYVVRVVGPEGQPVRNAAIYVEERGERRRSEMPMCAGRTGPDGRLRIDQVQTDEIRVSADHPRWGAVHATTKQGQGELVLTMAAPGAIEGTLTDGGKPATPGKYAVVVEHRLRSMPAGRGAIEEVPGLLTPGLEGEFTARALQPGTYRVQAIPALDAVTSPGGVMNLGQGMFMSEQNMPQSEVEVVSGQTTNVELDIGREQYTGPVGAVFGSVSVDGRLAAGYVMRAWTSAGRRVAAVDAAGRFDFQAMPAGRVHLTLMSSNASMFDRRGIWNTSFELEAAASKELVIDIQMTSLRGQALRPDGSPAAGVHVQAIGRPFDEASGTGNSWSSELTDAAGRFAFTDVPAGTFTLRVDGDGSEALRGELGDLRAEGGRPLDGLRLQLRAAIKVSGRVDLAVFATKPDWIWVGIHRPDQKDPGKPDRSNQITGFSVEDDGSFVTHELDPGRYFVRLHGQVDDTWQEYVVADPIVVTEAGASDLWLRPTPVRKE